MSRPESRVIVRVLDLSPIEVQATDWARDEGVVTEDQSLRLAFTPYGIIPTEKGHFVLSGYEGVGQTEPVEDKEFELAFYLRTPDGDGIVPIVTQSLSLDTLKKCMTEETVRLDKFIRTFGARLEQNFWMWENRVTKQSSSPK